MTGREGRLRTKTAKRLLAIEDKHFDSPDWMIPPTDGLLDGFPVVPIVKAGTSKGYWVPVYVYIGDK